MLGFISIESIRREERYRLDKPIGVTRKEFERVAGNSSGPSRDFPINQRGREISLMDVGHEPLKWTCRPFDLPRTWSGCRENCVTVERSGELGVCTPISRPSSSALLVTSPFSVILSLLFVPTFVFVGSFVRSYDHLSCFVATGRSYACRWTRTREKSHPRPGKYSALGSCPLDTTNRYSSFDMDLRVQPAAKFSRPTRIANARRLIISQI